MNQRLEALRRQRDIMRQHLRWLDEEIAAAQPEATVRQPPSPAPNLARQAPEPAGAPAAASPGEDPGSLPELDIQKLHGDVRRGCLIYFCVAAGVLGLIVGLIYLNY